VTAEDAIWIGQDGQKYGPYTEADVRQRLADGKLTGDTLAWRNGLAEWIPLATMFPKTAAREPPPPPPVRAFGGAYAGPSSAVDTNPATFSDGYSARHSGESETADAERAALPAPPSLHWGLVLLFTALTFGIFGIIWPFIQAAWVRKIDGQSRATLLMAIAVACFVVGESLYISGIVSSLHGGGAAGLAGFGALLVLAYLVFYLVAYFSMANSMRRNLPDYGLPVEIGGVTLFFLAMYYLQSQFNWVSRWKRTGNTSPGASKGIIWLVCFAVPFLVSMLAAISLPAYQDYLVRTQVSEGMALVGGAKAAVAEYYGNRGSLPPDNRSAGLADRSSIVGRYVSGVDVSEGRITVAFDTVNSNVAIRNKVLVLSPTPNGSAITWTCSADSTLPSRDFPLACRN
jgi:Tfp pilus assembly major pilin PilA